jgi:peptidoglycan/LPS O-acetylase OafA/YrhL
LSTIVLAALTALTAPEECNDINCPPRDVNGTHATLAKATIAMAAATIASGLYAHWNDFSLEDGWSDPDNLHVLLGVTGVALMAYAVNKSANSSVPVSHAGIAEAGALLMVVAIKLTW